MATNTKLAAKMFTPDSPAHVLSIGTRILLKDVMDQYLRSLGDVKTFYASKLSTALESYLGRRPAVIFCEHSFPEGSALEFIEGIGGLDLASDRYFVLAVESVNDELMSLAMEKGIDEILVKPFATDNVHQIMQRYSEKRQMAEIDWVKELRAARLAFQEKRFQESDELFGHAAKKNWHNAGVLLDCADYFLQRQQAARALPLVEKVLVDSPDHVRALNLHGRTLKRLGRFTEAVRELSRANDLSPLNTERRAELADAHVSLAEEQVLLALRTESESTALILRRAQYQLIRKDYAALVTYLDSKRSFLSDAGKREAESFVSLAKKMGGLK